MLDEKGFSRPTYDEIVESMAEKAKELFGNDLNTNETSLMGKMIRVVAFKVSEAWEDVEGSYFTAYLDTCRGLALDRIIPILGLSRNLAQPATGNVTFTGVAGYEVPFGFTIATEDNVQYIVTGECILDENGTGTVEVTCIESGVVGNCQVGDINVIVNPDENITSVTNEIAFTNGTEEESDYQLRERAKNSIGSQASSTINSIKGSLLGIDGVRAVAIYENNTNETDEMGIPGHSIKLYVYGGEDVEIAEMIFNKKPVGIGIVGDVEISVEDIAGVPHKVKFNRPNEVSTYYKVNLTVNSSFPSDGISQVKTTILQYIGGLDNDNVFYSGLSMGEDVVYMKLVSQILKIDGIEDFELETSTDNANFTTSNIEIAANEIAKSSADNITVVVTA